MVLFDIDKSLGGERRLLPGAAFAVRLMMVPPHINDLSFMNAILYEDRSLGGESRLLPGAAIAV